MNLVPLDQALEALRSSFPVEAEALDRCATILRLQHESLDDDPPPAELPDSVRLAAHGRLRGGGPVLPRSRFPLEPQRVEVLLVTLADTVPGVTLGDVARRDRLVEAAVLAAAADDGREVIRAVTTLGLSPEGGVALFREALKPEVLRLSLPFAPLLETDGERVTRCPLCGDHATVATQQGEGCCRWCGLLYPLSTEACAACDSRALRPLEPARFVEGARFIPCSDCGEVRKVFTSPPDPLVLSLHAVLAAPFELAMRVGAARPPESSFAVF